MFRTVLVAAAATFAFAPAPASADAVCSLQIDVRFDDNGRFSQDGPGHGPCAGNVGGVSLDPGAANPNIAGVATRSGECVSSIDTGDLVLRPRRAFEMWSPEHLELTGEWHAVAGALSGTLVTGGTAVTISGTIGFTGGCSDTGRLHVELLLNNERPAPRQEAATPEPAAPQKAQPERSRPAKKAKPRRKRACRKAKSRRAAKRCHRAGR